MHIKLAMREQFLSPSVLQGSALPPLTLTEEQAGVVTQATASDPGSAFIATATWYLHANSRPVMV